MKRFIVILFIISIVLASCKKEVAPSTDATTAELGRDELYSLLKEWYLWNKQLPDTINLKNYKDPYELMEAMRYKPIDRWSFVDDYDSFVASMQGTFVGHGISIGLDPQGKARIVTIYKNSPLYTNGLGGSGVRRGWIIKTLNGTDLASVLISGNVTTYNNLIGPSVSGRQNTFVFQTPRGNDTTATTIKSSFQVNSVMLYDTLTLKSGKTGHLVFDQFIDPSSDELKAAFAFFKAAKVNDLILDLRYNGGGILDVATELASYIAGSSKFATPFVSFFYNADKAAENNATTNFTTVLYPLNLSRLVVITTRNTASASEQIINGLRPHLAVTTIGDTTDGKPTGMDIYQYNYKYIFAPIVFKLVNSLGYGDFYAGFPPAKYVTDDITHDFSDRNEYCFKEAIYFLENNTVSTKGSYFYKPSIHYSEKSARMNNTYILNRLLIKGK